MTDHGRSQGVGRSMDAPADACAHRGAIAAEAACEDCEELRKALDGLQDKYLRVQADLANIRRRTGDERQAGRRAGQHEFLRAILSALDAFDRCLTTRSTDEAFQEGVAAIHALLIASLREVGAERIESVGRCFDPQVHDAVATRPAHDPSEVGTVVEVVRAGWRLAADVVRPASVVVALEAHPAPDPQPADADRGAPTGVSVPVHEGGEI